MRERGPWTIPNALTALRLVLTPFFAAALLAGDLPRAWLLFLLAGVSDGLDGLLARLLDQRSSLGRVLDPLADKLLLGTAFALLAWTGRLPVWLTVLAVGRDVVILAGLAALRRAGVEVFGRIRPTLVSKLNTLCQLVLTFLTLSEAAGGGPYLGGVPRDLLIVLAGLLAVASGVRYVRQGLALRPARQGAPAG